MLTASALHHPTEDPAEGLAEKVIERMTPRAAHERHSARYYLGRVTAYEVEYLSHPPAVVDVLRAAALVAEHYERDGR